MYIKFGGRRLSWSREKKEANPLIAGENGEKTLYKKKKLRRAEKEAP